MSRTSGIPRASESAWTAELLRVTLFHAHTDEVKAEGWWQMVTGMAPDGSIGKPKTGERIELGKLDDTTLVLHAKQLEGRIDWVLTWEGEPSDNPPSFPDKATVLLNLMANLFSLEVLPSINRVAFGALVVLPIPGDTLGHEGYATISNYLTFDISRDTASDFMFQINRKRSSTTIPEVEVNRLTKWSVIKAVTRQIVLISSDGIVASPAVASALEGCHLELDISTAKVDVAFPGDMLTALLTELVDLGRELIREGDVP